MSRKDYVVVAEVVREVRVGMPADNINALINALSYMFATDNSRFDRSRFVAACGGLA